MEILDVVNENGIPTGETVPRVIAHANGIRHRTAHVWIIQNRPDGIYVLLQKRAKNKDSFPGKLDTSSAGHVVSGDTPITSALRELQEELGVQVSEDRLLYAGNFRISYEKEFYGKPFRDNEIAFVYVLQLDKPIEFSLQKDEIEEVEWFPVSEVIDKVGARDERFCVPKDGLEVLCSFLNSFGMQRQFFKQGQ